MGTNVDNAGGAGFSGDLGAQVFGYGITQKVSGRYDQSPMETADIDIAWGASWKAATVSKAAWMTYHQQNHADVYTWLQGLTEGERTKLWEQAKVHAAAAEHFATL